MDLLSCRLYGQPVSRYVRPTPEEPPTPCPVGFTTPCSSLLIVVPPASRPAPLSHERALSDANRSGTAPPQQAKHPCIEGASTSPWFCLSGLDKPPGVILGQRKALGQGETELLCGLLLPISQDFLADCLHLARAEAGHGHEPSSPTLFLEDEDWLPGAGDSYSFFPCPSNLWHAAHKP